MPLLPAFALFRLETKTALTVAATTMRRTMMSKVTINRCLPRWGLWLPLLLLLVLGKVHMMVNAYAWKEECKSGLCMLLLLHHYCGRHCSLLTVSCVQRSDW